MWSMRSVDHFTRKGQPNKVQNSRLKFRDRHNSVLSKSYEAYKFHGILFQKPMIPRQILYSMGCCSTSQILYFGGYCSTSQLTCFPDRFIHLSRIMGHQDNEISTYESPLGFSRSCNHKRHKIDSHSSKHHTTNIRAQIILINFPQIRQFWTFSHQLCSTTMLTMETLCLISYKPKPAKCNASLS